MVAISNYNKGTCMLDVNFLCREHNEMNLLTSTRKGKSFYEIVALGLGDLTWNVSKNWQEREPVSPR